MALPEITLPPGLPKALAVGHAIDIAPVHADVGMRTGHARRRRIYTVADRAVEVSWIFTQAQATQFHNWFEGPLQAGALLFSVEVRNQGQGTLWWKAQFVEPYRAEPFPPLLWRVSARLRLIGDGSVTPPAATSLLADTVVALVGSATLVIAQTLSADTVVALVAAGSSLSADTVVVLTSTVNGATPSAVDFEKRWLWMRYPYAQGRTADVTDTSEFDQRSWFGLGS